MADMKNGGKDSAYPHAYVNFCNYGNKSRILPISYDINMKEEWELEVKFTFNTKGSAPDAVYIRGSQPFGTHVPPDQDCTPLRTPKSKILPK